MLQSIRKLPEIDSIGKLINLISSIYSLHLYRSVEWFFFVVISLFVARCNVSFSPAEPP